MIKLEADKKRPKKEKFVWTKGRKLGCLAWVVAIPLIVVACNSGGDDDKPKITPKPAVEAKAEPKAHVGKDDAIHWEDRVMKIALNESLHGGKSGQIDQIVLFAKSTDFSDSVIKKFEADIVKSYKSKTYLTSGDIAKLQYFYQAVIVERYYDDKLQKPIDKFAFDYMQNLKDSYRGVTDSIKANEAQMNKALAEIK